MKLYIGGKYQGQETVAQTANPQSDIFFNFHETICEACLRGEDPRIFAEHFFDENPDAIIVSDEVGSGIVPLSASDRSFRENVGRALCVLAARSESVTRVICGIPVKLK